MTISGLRELTEHRGPFASVYVGTVSDTEDAAQQQRLQVRAVREALSEDGAQADVLDAVEQGLADLPPGRAGQAVIADADGLLLAKQLPQPPDRTTTRVSPMPYLLPLLRLRRATQPHVVALVDERGADLYTVDAHGVRTDHTLEGTQHPVHKVRGGGFAHQSMQSRVEETVRRTIDATAEDVERLADQVGAAFVIVAGEITARTALGGALASHRHHVVQLEGFNRQDPPGRAEFEQRVDQVIDRQAEDHLHEVAARFEQGSAHELAVQGVPATADALARRNVETLLIEPGSLGDRDVHVGSDPTFVQADDPRTGDSVRRRADEALPLAAVAADSEIVVVDPEFGLTEGVGAVLRHS
ncbi:Rv2629 family ribosome hibernation factor [Nocardia vermiculata]|uniref:Peptide chain release factor 2 n=1 Tax=Nocardia vermiculata TaxID=257274 RepID=A0A846XZ76_9NOCA|nr:Vms1/Ankzf1 family peptidyl-tRNA hydrolase [Nocardia vermiculata]NKY51090.1 peptide chain release factor 2 [Nocardia vermiculata]